MRPQAFLDGIRSSRGMGMGNTRMRDDRSADQDQTQSGNPNLAFNQPMMRDNRAMMPGGANKAPPQSFNHAVRPQLGPIRGGGPTQQQQMPPQQGLPSWVDQRAVDADPAAFAAYLEQAAREAPDSAAGQLAAAQGIGGTAQGAPVRQPMRRPMSGQFPQQQSMPQQRPQQPMPVDPRRMNFTRPYFRQ